MKIFRLWLAILCMGGSAAADSSFDAAVFANDRTYIFKDFGYWRLKGGAVEDGYPKPMNVWGGLPDEFLSNLDAALYSPESKKIYFFKGANYVRISGRTMDKGYPAPIARWWKGLPPRFHRDLDAALYRGGHAYFFKGNEYVRFTGTTMDDGYPRKLPGGWGLSGAFTGKLDAALDHPVFKKNYFFSGERYVRLTDTKADDGYPKPNTIWISRTAKDTTTDLVVGTDFVSAMLTAIFAGTELYLDNYNGKFHANASTLTLPPQLVGGSQPRVIKIGIPERVSGHFYYYINNIRSTGLTFGVTGKRLTMRIDFESDETEVPGRCFHSTVLCPFGDDDTAPDLQWNNLSVGVSMTPVARAGKIYLTDAKVTIGGQPELQGVCEVVSALAFGDLCDSLSDYKSTIRNGIADGLETALNAAALQETLADGVTNALRQRFQLELIAKVAVRDGQFIVTHGFPDAGTLFGATP